MAFVDEEGNVYPADWCSYVIKCTTEELQFVTNLDAYCWVVVDEHMFEMAFPSDEAAYSWTVSHCSADEDSRIYYWVSDRIDWT